MDISLECPDTISMENFNLKTPTRRTTKKLPLKKRTTKKLSPTKLTTKKLSASSREKRPPNKVRYDQTNHFPEADGLCNATRCKNEGCVQKTHFICIKCGIHLCIKSGRNCFKDFHELF